MLLSQQLWRTAFPALAGITVAIGSFAGGGSLLQAGAAGLATGMTGYLASALSVGEAKVRIQGLEQSLQHQKQSDLNTLNLHQLQQQLQEELATLQDILQHLQQDFRKERTNSGQPRTETQTEAQTSQLQLEIESQKRLLTELKQEEQALKDSVQDLQIKKQKLIRYLKEGMDKIDQLKSKRDYLQQDIARLIQARQQTSNIRSQVTAQVANSSAGITFSSSKPTAIPNLNQHAQGGNKYDKYDTIL